ncbi:MAG: hypothetical protein ACYDAO_02660 [Thermoplasmataceae archaeon]
MPNLVYIVANELSALCVFGSKSDAEAYVKDCRKHGRDLCALKDPYEVPYFSEGEV